MQASQPIPALVVSQCKADCSLQSIKHGSQLLAWPRRLHKNQTPFWTIYAPFPSSLSAVKKKEPPIFPSNTGPSFSLPSHRLLLDTRAQEKSLLVPVGRSIVGKRKRHRSQSAKVIAHHRSNTFIFGSESRKQSHSEISYALLTIYLCNTSSQPTPRHPPFPKLHVETRCRYGKSNQRSMCRTVHSGRSNTRQTFLWQDMHAVSTPCMFFSAIHPSLLLSFSTRVENKNMEFGRTGPSRVGWHSDQTLPPNRRFWVQISYFSLRSREEKGNPVRIIVFLALSVFRM